MSNIMNKNFNLQDYERDLRDLWKGSGFSRDAMHKKLKKDFTHGRDASLDESLAIFHFENFSVVCGIFGYYFVKKA